MFSKLFIAPIFLLALTSSVDAHALIEPALGVSGAGTRNDVQQPSPAKPCGNVDIAQGLNSLTAAQASADGIFSASITDFNGGTDGSRSIKTVQVDGTGTGNTFVAAKMVTNGNPNPTSAGTEQITAQLPPGTKCSGGPNKNLCLASFTTTGGFGNCLLVSQQAEPSNSVLSPSTTPTASNPAASKVATTNKNGTTGKGGANGDGCGGGDNPKKDTKKGKQGGANSSAVPSATSQATADPTGVSKRQNRRAEQRAADDDDQGNLAKGSTHRRSWSSRKFV